MSKTRSIKQGVAKVFKLWRDEDYDAALLEVEQLMEVSPGNAQLQLLWASLVQLQENPKNDLDEVRKALQDAVDLDKNSPVCAIELGHFLDAVDDNPRAASKVFAEGAAVARRLLIEALLGQANAQLQSGKRESALKCLSEALYLSDRESATNGASGGNGTDSHRRRDSAELSVQIEDLLQEFSAKRSA